ncbi:hypothetical protein RN001_001101 [Aquatica leii]|uniref:Tyr recombinase domain-containing protein n=1 Tax=Aquatica leii TaxID=1421715 RepID=A0AAN7PB19_9COLE|nr:hypothetical protein RN001_001101 [Aquatica leii]
MSNSESIDCTPPEVRQDANEALVNLLPKKSKARYELAYSKFVNWARTKKISNFTENVLLAYFQTYPNKKSLWATYSMLKACLILHDNINISNYSKLIAFLKRETEHYQPKKSKVLEEEQIAKFINDAPNNDFLLMKVVLIMGVAGACRREELCKMALKDIEFKTDMISVTIPDTKTYTTRRFVIVDPKWISLLKEYKNIRAKCNQNQDRFFFTYHNGKCINSPVGINTFGKIPSLIASYLKLENSKEYTGHCFRRTSATMLANHGGDLVTLKRHGGWKSSTVAEGYIEESVSSRIATAQKLTAGTSSTGSGSSFEIPVINVNMPPASTTVTQSLNMIVPGVQISNSGTLNINSINVTICNSSNHR